jgi:hypothetical protein
MNYEFVSCLACSRVQASRAVSHLINAGFAYNEISVLFPCGRGFRNRTDEAPHSAAPVTAPEWAVGGSLGWLTDIGSFSLPGIGRFVVAGPLSLALGGPTATMSSAAVRDALLSLGMDRVQAGLCEASVRDGETFISYRAHSPQEAEGVRRIIRVIRSVRMVTTERNVPRLTPELLDEMSHLALAGAG